MTVEPANDNTPPPKLHFLAWLMVLVAGANPKILRYQCPQDISKVLAQAGLLIGTFIYSSVVLTMISNRLFAADHFSFGLMLGAVGVSALIAAADAYIYLHCSWLKDGVTELKKVGWDIPLPASQRVRMNLFLANRLLLAFGWAYFIGLSLGLIIYASDIRTRLEAQYLNTNATIVAEAARLYDAEIRSQTDAVNVQEGVLRALARQVTSLRQKEVTRIIHDKQRLAGTALDGRIAPFETRLEQEQAKLDGMKKRLADLVGGRNKAIRQAVDNSPNRVPFTGDNFLAQVKALDEIAAENPKVGLLIAVLEIIAVGLELAPILAKLLGLNPTVYSAVVARDHIVSLSRVGEVLGHDLGGDPPPEPPASAPALSNVVSFHRPANENVAPPVQIPKKKRGRPRKYPPAVNGSGM